MKTNKIMLTLGIAGISLAATCGAYANTDDAISSTKIASPPEIYNDGLMAVVYTEEAESGTWASPSPVGIPIGEFVDEKVPTFKFSNLKQEPQAWSLYSGAHIGILWEGYFHAEETGDYVFMVEAQKKDKKYYRANSCIMDMQLSDSSVVKNSFKWKAESSFIDDDETHHETKFNKVSLESGYYPVSIWLHCGVTRGDWKHWVNESEVMTWTFKLKRPSDRIVQVAPKGTLVWK